MAIDAAETRKSMRTRSVNTEILFNLSSSRNITESLKTFGATERDTDILLCSIDKVNTYLSAHSNSVVDPDPDQYTP